MNMDITHIARLARLALTDEELEHYQDQLSAILDYAARLNELDLSSAAILAEDAPPLGRYNVLRDDIVTPSLPRDDAPVSYTHLDVYKRQDLDDELEGAADVQQGENVE